MVSWSFPRWQVVLIRPDDKLAPLTGLVRIGTGRDAADVAFATITGDAVLTEKSVWALPSQDSQPVKADSQSAVSTA